MDITYTNTITVEQYNSLRKAVGWNEIQEDLAERGLHNSAFLIVLANGGVPFGMARVITDYGYIVLISDVVVHPDYQGKGYGREIMEKVMEYINGSIAPGQMKMINLMAAQGKEGFYKKFGFLERPYEGKGAGMSQWISGDRIF
ncbi:MAG: GNAT family N-acetyltransferase [Clostridiales bacterium]|nr:GNAT family N-acetyltransferase [Clostridiales bacterium]